VVDLDVDCGTARFDLDADAVDTEDGHRRIDAAAFLDRGALSVLPVGRVGPGRLHPKENVVVVPRARAGDVSQFEHSGMDGLGDDQRRHRLRHSAALRCLS
jgi:hypothetical protein